MNPGDRDKAQRSMQIFMPTAADQLDRFRSSNNNFVHYTSAENAIKIIRSRSFWMRNTRGMNDHKEVEHGCDCLQSFFAERIKRQAFSSALDPCHDGAADEAIARFEQWIPEIRSNTYIVSISEHESKEDEHGRLSM